MCIRDSLLLTQWSVSKGAREIGNKTGEKLEAVKVKIQKKREEYQVISEEIKNNHTSYHLKEFIFKKSNDIQPDKNEKNIDEEIGKTVFLQDKIYETNGIEENEAQNKEMCIRDRYYDKYKLIK